MILAEPIFLSIQGEGPNSGKPSVFVRFYGCNLCCKWCDSLYAVNNPESLIKISIKEACEQIKKFKCKNIVFTGGEPTLFSNDIQAIQDALGFENYTREIETNGSIPIRNRFNQINISPKLSNSGNDPYKMKALYELPLYAVYPISIAFKFVAKGKEDFKDIKAFIKKYGVGANQIRIMPEGIDAESQSNQEVLQFCLDNNFRYCQRLHILLFGNKKGV